MIRGIPRRKEIRRQRGLAGRVEAFSEEGLDRSDVDEEMGDGEVQWPAYDESRDLLLTEEISLRFMIGDQRDEATILDEQISSGDVTVRVPQFGQLRHTRWLAGREME